MLQRTGALLLGLLVVAMQLRQDTILYGAPCRYRPGQSGRDKLDVFSMARLYTLRVRFAWVALHHRCTMGPKVWALLCCPASQCSARAEWYGFVLQVLTHKLLITIQVPSR